MLTPSGRFAIQQKLCLSISDFHPESWYVLSCNGSSERAAPLAWLQQAQAAERCQRIKKCLQQAPKTKISSLKRLSAAQSCGHITMACSRVLTL